MPYQREKQAPQVQCVQNDQDIPACSLHRWHMPWLDQLYPASDRLDLSRGDAVSAHPIKLVRRHAQKPVFQHSKQTIVSGYSTCTTLMFFISSGDKSPNCISCMVLRGAPDGAKVTFAMTAVLCFHKSSNTDRSDGATPLTSNPPQRDPS